MGRSVLVALGGGIGAALRHLVNLGASLRLLGPGFPWGTMAINVAGSLAMGVFVEIWLAGRFGGVQRAAAVRRDRHPRRLHDLLGLLAGFRGALGTRRGAAGAGLRAGQRWSGRLLALFAGIVAREKPRLMLLRAACNGRAMAGVEQITVEAGEAGMRLDRWFKAHYPGLGFVPAAEAPALGPGARRRRSREGGHAGRTRAE